MSTRTPELPSLLSHPTFRSLASLSGFDCSTRFLLDAALSITVREWWTCIRSQPLCTACPLIELLDNSTAFKKQNKHCGLCYKMRLLLW
ncbi:MAG TPA: hypothetical protein DDW52_02515 [Planctomycetaceae bacterium]|nr:hypothetical protein [Planctomycetaceae bacterium]